MSFKDYYIQRFRDDLESFIADIPVHIRTHMAEYHSKGCEGDMIQVSSLCKAAGHIQVIPEETRVEFVMALFHTLLLDQFFYTYYRDLYADFRQLTVYPKLIGACPQGCYHNLPPKLIIALLLRFSQLEDAKSVFAESVLAMREETEEFLHMYFPQLEIGEFWQRYQRELANCDICFSLNLPDKIMKIVEKHDRQMIDRGYVADILYFRNAPNSPNYYLKRHASRCGHDSFKEYKAHQFLKDKLPVADAVAYISKGGFDYLLITEMPGKSFEESGLADDLPELARILAAGLKRVHSMPVGDCGFSESVQGKLDRIKRNIQLGWLRHDVYGNDLSRDPVRDFEYLQKNMPVNGQKVLTHGDFNLDNLLFADSCISAFLDLGEVGIGDPYQDFSTLWQSLKWWLGTAVDADEMLSMIMHHYGLGELDSDTMCYFKCLNEML